MQALRVHPAPPNTTPYSPTNPAPTSSLILDNDIPIPSLTSPNELLIRVKASAVIRDTLTWPETYRHAHFIPGNDIAGTVVAVHPDLISSSSSSSRRGGLEVGDDVFGMTRADRAGAWAEYAVVKSDEVVRKSRGLSWEEAAAVPLSGQTAYEALFVRGGVPVPRDEDVLLNRSGERKKDEERKSQKVLITGAAGGVGVYLVQLASLAGLHVVAATSSNERNEAFLKGLGADEVVEYAGLSGQADVYDLVVDTVGGDVLINSWRVAKEQGTLISVDSSSFDFVAEHEKRGIRRDGVKALFFIVEGTVEGLRALGHFADLGLLKVFVLDSFPLSEGQAAYEKANGRMTGHGKVIITM